MVLDNPWLRSWKTLLQRCGIPVLFWLLGLIIVPACTPTETPLDPTAQALAQRFEQTVTARALVSSQSSAELENDRLNATLQAAAVKATRTAESYAKQLTLRGTQDSLAPILAELPLYGVDPGIGRIGWIHSPLEISLDGYRQSAFKNDYPLTTARDFVIAADITWDTQYGTSGCGFVVRGNGDSEKPSLYSVAASRGGTGYIYFLAQVAGEFTNYDSLYANGIDARFEWENGTKNRIVVVGRGSSLTVYSNYTLIGAFDAAKAPTKPKLPKPPVKPELPKINKKDPNYQKYMDEYHKALLLYNDNVDEFNALKTEVQEKYDLVQDNFDPEQILQEGFMGFAGFTSSGSATCKFENAWLWLIN